MNPTDVSAIDASRAEIGVVCSLSLEIAPFLSRCQRVKTYSGGAFKFVGGIYNGIRVAVVEAGTGSVRARGAPHWRCSMHISRSGSSRQDSPVRCNRS